uniref:Uncharacterized protein n=1 Tax=Panagrolaimus davidi TaxID=227884 RepID=A0A914QDL3_9BILA
MIAYILKNDLSKQQLDQYHYECPFVHLRHFNVSKYPTFVQNLNEYRWKPIIVSEVLEEVESVFYFDSSIIFLNQDGESIKDVFEKMDTEFSKCGIRQFGRVGHTIFAATHPKMFELFNISSQIVKQNFMYSANSFVVTPKASKIIRKWTECALEKECMAPEGSKLYCMLPILWEGKYANCHRFDQSALALLTLQCSLDTKDFFQPSYLLDTKRIESPPFVTREMIFILLIIVGIYLIYLLSSNRNVLPFEFLESSSGPSKSSTPRGVPP